MANFKKVVLTEKDTNIATDSSSVMKQLEKFDNTYTSTASNTSKKLENLYNEFDSITFNNANTVTEEVASVKVEEKTSINAKVFVASAIIVTLLLAFLSIYNIFVINGLNSNIQLLQTTEIAKNLELDALKAENAELLNSVTEKLNGEFSAVNDKIIIDLIEKQQVESVVADSNWFDAICNFLANLFK